MAFQQTSTIEYACIHGLEYSTGFYSLSVHNGGGEWDLFLGCEADNYLNTNQMNGTRRHSWPKLLEIDPALIRRWKFQDQQCVGKLLTVESMNDAVFMLGGRFCGCNDVAYYSERFLNYWRSRGSFDQVTLIGLRRTTIKSTIITHSIIYDWTSEILAWYRPKDFWATK